MVSTDRHTEKESASPLDTIIRQQKRGIASGLTSVCSANPYVVDACFRHAKENGLPVLIESTCNQVNQYGGYSGMTPADFAAFIRRNAEKYGFPSDRLILGGDHLGPSVWQDEPSAPAMEKASLLVRDCVRAGYAKIHLDASMKCADDPSDQPLSKEVSARRVAALAAVAEDAFFRGSGSQRAPQYIIGTEVPLPGGILGDEEHLQVTTPEEAQETIEVTRDAFVQAGLDQAWERVVAVVVQPGVEYGNQVVIDYQPEKVVALSHFIESYDHLVYEAHSTDYQTPHRLRDLVRDHFAILKVGPALTFAFREAIFALSHIEEELSEPKETSNIRAVLEKSMLSHPGYWEKHYSGTPQETHFARKYSFSDRSRYYWPDKTVQQALARLFENLRGQPIPLSLLSQYLPEQYVRVRQGTIPADPAGLVRSKVESVLADYAYACQPEPGGSGT